MHVTDISPAIEALSAATPQSTIMLFGSRARGEARPDSDWDLLVIEPEVHSRHQEMARLSRLLRPFRISADILVLSRKIFDEWANVPNTVIYEAAREGKILYAPA